MNRTIFPFREIREQTSARRASFEVALFPTVENTKTRCFLKARYPSLLICVHGNYRNLQNQAEKRKKNSATSKRASEGSVLGDARPSLARRAKVKMIVSASWRAILILVFGLMSADLLAAESGTRERAFVRALELFDSAKTPDDYRESAKVLESILADGFRSGAVFYNLGNAYYRAGDLGRAILNYRKAKPYRPRDPYLTANLEQSLATAPGRLAEPPRPWWSHVLFWTEWLSFPRKVQATFVGLCTAGIATTLAVLFRLPRLNLPIVGLILISIAIGVDCSICYSEVNHSRQAVIISETIARKGIGNSYEPAFDQPLRDGAEFQILSETSDWTFGHFESIGDGWVPNECVAR